VATGIYNLNSLEHSISITPNPAHDYITVSGNNVVIENIKLLNVEGGEIFVLHRSKGSSGSDLIDISKLPSAIYILKVQTEKGVITKTVSVSHY
ncbi:MAG: T9SS type A sorting domain-containing protein, partial [Chitinophagales bacterium]|nr:T9SS type A sorting domain-containing protein [Chitinophagales bacterium]